LGFPVRFLEYVFRWLCVTAADRWSFAASIKPLLSLCISEAIVWELICHHTYKWHGLATDLSVYDNHGAVAVPATDILADGASPGSGALHFASGSHIQIGTGPSWRPLAGVRVECIVRATAHSAQTQTLIEAHDSFTIFTSDGALAASFSVDPSIPRMLVPGLIGTFTDGVTFPRYRLPINKWVRLQLVHDGLTQMQLFADGEAVTRSRTPLSPVPGVGAKGIRIGNALAGTEPFNGDVDEIQIWRLDPRAVRNAFLERPVDKATADCWARYAQSLRAAFVKHPDCAAKLIGGTGAAVDRWLRAMTAQGPETRQRFDEVRERYAELWRAGNLDGPEMRALIADWCTWLRLVGISPDGDDAFQKLKQSECWKLIQGELAGLDCDPQAMALIALFNEECGCGGEPRRDTTSA
jgi:hypothetical protein